MYCAGTGAGDDVYMLGGHVNEAGLRLDVDGLESLDGRSGLELERPMAKDSQSFNVAQ